MKDFRLLGYGVLICLPLVAFCALGTYFLVDKVPQLLAQQRKENSLAYRQTALRLWESPDEADFYGPREKGWRQTGRIGSRREGFVPWGHVPQGEEELVWIGSTKFICGVRVPHDEAFDIPTVFTWAVGFVFLLLLTLTIACLRFFIRYAEDRDAFVAATVHDLATPLVGLRRMLGVDIEESRNLVERMMHLVDNLRAFLNRGGRRAPPNWETFNIREPLEEAYRIFREDFRDLWDGHDLEVTGEPELIVSADRAMTEQILWNLLSNELKYAAPYGAVVIRMGKEGNWVRIEFADEGKGLSSSERRHLFDRYYRAKSARKSGKGGFGIGLCTAREFARALGGDLRVVANHPRGCVFVLMLQQGVNP